MRRLRYRQRRRRNILDFVRSGLFYLRRKDLTVMVEESRWIMRLEQKA